MSHRRLPPWLPRAHGHARPRPHDATYHPRPSASPRLRKWSRPHSQSHPALTPPPALRPAPLLPFKHKYRVFAPGGYSIVASEVRIQKRSHTKMACPESSVCGCKLSNVHACKIRVCVSCVWLWLRYFYIVPAAGTRRSPRATLELHVCPEKGVRTYNPRRACLRHRTRTIIRFKRTQCIVEHQVSFTFFS